jgi:anti-sigma regulatory factor (Ser/Thr protein kinase)
MGQLHGWSSQAVFPAEESSVGRARGFVAAQLAAHDLLHLDDDIRLVASELATNAVAHAATPFVVTLEQYDGSVRLVVDDGSVHHPLVGTAEPTALNGRGLVLVRDLSRDWGVSGGSDRGAKGVWATFDATGTGEHTTSA